MADDKTLLWTAITCCNLQFLGMFQSSFFWLWYRSKTFHTEYLWKCAMANNKSKMVTAAKRFSLNNHYCSWWIDKALQLHYTTLRSVTRWRHVNYVFKGVSNSSQGHAWVLPRHSQQFLMVSTVYGMLCNRPVFLLVVRIIWWVLY